MNKKFITTDLRNRSGKVLKSKVFLTNADVFHETLETNVQTLFWILRAAFHQLNGKTFHRVFNMVGHV